MSDGGVGTEVGSGSGSSATTGTGASDDANGANADGADTAGPGAGESSIDEEVVLARPGPVLTSVDADDPVATVGAWLATRVGSTLSEAGVCANFCCCSNACARA